MPRNTSEKPNRINRLYCLLVLTRRRVQTIMGIILIYPFRFGRFCTILVQTCAGRRPAAQRRYTITPAASIARHRPASPGIARTGQHRPDQRRTRWRQNQTSHPPGPSAAIGGDSGRFPASLLLTDAFFIRQSAHPIDYAGKTDRFRPFSDGLTDSAYLSAYNVVYGLRLC